MFTCVQEMKHPEYDTEMTQNETLLKVSRLHVRAAIESNLPRSSPQTSQRTWMQNAGYLQAIDRYRAGGARALLSGAALRAPLNPINVAPSTPINQVHIGGNMRKQGRRVALGSPSVLRGGFSLDN